MKFNNYHLYSAFGNLMLLNIMRLPHFVRKNIFKHHAFNLNSIRMLAVAILMFSCYGYAVTLSEIKQRALLLEQLKITLNSNPSNAQIKTLFNTINIMNYNTNRDIEENNKKIQDLTKIENLRISYKPLQDYAQNLANQKKNLIEEVAALNILSYKITSIKQSILLVTQTSNPYNLLVKNTQSLLTQWKEFHITAVHFNPINFNQFSQLLWYALLYASLFICSYPVIVLHFIKHCRAEKLLSFIQAYAYHGLILVTLFFGLSQSLLLNTKPPLIDYVNFRPVLYCLIPLFIVIFIIPRDPYNKNESVIQTILFRCRMVVLLGFLLQLIALMLSPIPLLNTFVLFAYITGLIWVLFAMLDQNYFNKNGLLKKTTQISLVILYGCLLIGTGLGYQQFGQWFIPNIMMTAMIAVFFHSLNHVLIKFKDYFTQTRNKITRKINRFFDLKRGQKLFEVFILRYILLLGLFGYTLILLSEVWGVTPYEIYEFVNDYAIQNDLKINFVLLLRLMILFCILMILSRTITIFIVQTIKHKQTRNAVKLLIQSILFIINIIIIFIALNIKIMAILAISTGLFVGLGFGLRQFVSDVLYGLYMNVTRIFQPNDQVRAFISRNEIEGVIGKTGLIFTQIKTTEYSDLFIPNSKVCEQGVINYTYKNNTLHLFKIKFELEHMSEIQKAKEILLCVAKNSPEILQNKQHEPRIELIANNLVLECAISNIALKYQIMTELELNLLKEFNDNNISIKLV